MIIVLYIIIIAVVIVGIVFYLRRRTYLGKKLIVSEQDYTIIRISVPKENEKTPQAAEALFAALHGIYKTKHESKEEAIQDFVSFEIVARENSVSFYVFVPTHLRDFVEGQIYAQYPDIEIEEIGDYTKVLDEKGFKVSHTFAGTNLELTKDDVYPIKTFEDFEVDPLASITAVLSKVKKGEEIWIQFVIRPASDEWQERGISHVKAIKEGKTPGTSFLSIFFKGTLNFLNELYFTATHPERETEEKEIKLPGPVEAALEGVETKVTKLGFQTKIRIGSLALNKINAEARINAAVGAFKQFNTNNMNGFKIGGIDFDDKDFLEKYRKRLFIKKGCVLNIEELASLFHLPNISVETPTIVWAGAKKGEPPANLPIITEKDLEGKGEIDPFAEVDFREGKARFGIKVDDRRRHMYLIGRTGTGKTTMLQNMSISDIETGKGVAIVDPHGDFIETIINFIPKHRIDDVVLFDPSDTLHPIGFNLLENVNPDLKNIVSSGLIGIFKKLWADSWGPRLEHILRNTILALLDYPNATMLGIMKMLVDENYRRRVVDKVTDPVVRDFWINEFERYDQRFRTEAVAPIQNKVGQFLSSSTIRNILGQPKSTIDLEDIMDNKKILLINLAKGKIGEDNSALIGAMMITKIQITAMQRTRVPERERIDFYLYVDEFQNFATESFAVILSEARKYRLSIIMANQYIAQMSEEVQDAVFGNVGTIITFRIGATDAPLLAKEYIPTFEETDLINLDKYHIYVKMSIDGVTTMPFSAVTLAPFTETTPNRDQVVEASRQKYTRAKNQVEAEIEEHSASAIEELIKQGESGERKRPPAQARGPSERPTRAQESQERPAKTQEAPQEERKSTEDREMPIGWQEITDVSGIKFYILYRDKDEGGGNKDQDPQTSGPQGPQNEAKEEPKGNKSEIINQNDEKMTNDQNQNSQTDLKANQSLKQAINDAVQQNVDENGHIQVEEGKEVKIER